METFPPRRSCGGSRGSTTQSHCWCGCMSSVCRKSRSRSVPLQCRPRPSWAFFSFVAHSSATKQLSPSRRRPSCSSTLPQASSLIWLLIIFSFSYTIFSDIVCCLLSNVCVVTSFYQSLQTMSSFMYFPFCAIYCTLSQILSTYKIQVRQAADLPDLNPLFIYYTILIYRKSMVMLLYYTILYCFSQLKQNL